MRILLLFLLALAGPLAAKPDVSREQLEELREKIHELQEEVEERLRERNSLRNQLRKTEEQIGQITADIHRLTREMEQTRERLQELTRQRNRLAEKKAGQLEWLKRTIRATYRRGRQAKLKLLLNQEKPARIARLLRYQSYFQQTRGRRIRALSEELDKLRKLTHKIQQTRQKLAHKRRKRKNQREELRQALDQRKEALAKLNQQLQQGRSRLASLREDAQRLERLLDQMSPALESIPASPEQPFAELQGQLPWPVDGEILVQFGSSRAGGLNWKGVVLDASLGEPVRAIHGGRVVYADWLRGYGLLTIINHGNGYLSLYGYNRALLRDVGEWVSAGDVIALAGKSGGRSQASVYFEIRYQGEPLNPNRWCSRRVTLPPLDWE